MLTRRTYGPQHVLVTRFIARLEMATAADWVEAARVLDAMDEHDWGMALRAVRDAAGLHELTHCVEQASTAARRAAVPAAKRLDRDDPRLTMIAPSMFAAAAGGAGALVLRGLLPPTAASTLYLPWADVMPLYEIEPG